MYDLLKFERLSTLESNTLIGGFSIALDGLGMEDDCAVINNCNGGNYKHGCGKDTVKTKKKKKVVVPNGNCAGNCVPGCGDSVTH